eukprot:TRINITY_DN2198_c0_g1_i1.p1 TRINITY_DN2198_c0_g1~~TRINITY_DN2198_c0_g1_i1.p1  ORF type:complete len:658 (-),score=185.24 TRINITY_DN2198_c0_g1_i1:28-2001(-)
MSEDGHDQLRIGDMVMYKYNDRWFDGSVQDVNANEQWFEVKQPVLGASKKMSYVRHRISATGQWLRAKDTTIRPPPPPKKPRVMRVPYYFTLVQNSVQNQPKLPKLFSKPFPEEVQVKKRLQPSNQPVEPLETRFEFTNFFDHKPVVAEPPPIPQPAPRKRARPPRQIGGPNFRGVQVDRQYEVSNLPLAGGIDPAMFAWDNIDPEQIIPVSSTALIENTSSLDHIIEDTNDYSHLAPTQRPGFQRSALNQRLAPTQRPGFQRPAPNQRPNNARGRQQQQPPPPPPPPQQQSKQKQKSKQKSEASRDNSQIQESTPDTYSQSQYSLGQDFESQRSHVFEDRRAKPLDNLASAAGIVSTDKYYDFEISSQEKRKLKEKIFDDEDEGIVSCERNYCFDLGNGYTTKRFDLDITQDHLREKKYSLEVAEEEKRYDVQLHSKPAPIVYGMEPEEVAQSYDVAYEQNPSAGYEINFVDDDNESGGLVDWGGAAYNDVLDVKVFVMGCNNGDWDAASNVEVIEIVDERDNESSIAEEETANPEEFFTLGNVFEDVKKPEPKKTAAETEKEEIKRKKKEKKKKNKGKEKVGDEGATVVKEVEKNKVVGDVVESVRGENLVPTAAETKTETAKYTEKQMKRRNKWDQRKAKRKEFSKSRKTKAKS